MFAIRRNADPEAKRWESGQPIGWVITIDGEWAFFSREERDEFIGEIRAEELRAMEVRSPPVIPQSEEERCTQ